MPNTTHTDARATTRGAISRGTVASSATMGDERESDFHEWTLADFTSTEPSLGIEQRLKALREHQCTPQFAKHAVRAFCQLDVHFFLQMNANFAHAVDLICNHASTGDKAMSTHAPNQTRTVARAAALVERAWEEFDRVPAAERQDIYPNPTLTLLEQATEAFIAPFERIDSDVRVAAMGKFPLAWLPSGKDERAFASFDAVQLNANSIQYGGEKGQISALFRLATLRTSDAYLAMAALLMDCHKPVIDLARPYEDARACTSPEDRFFVYQGLPWLVRKAQGPSMSRPLAIRTYLLRPLSALRRAGALENDAADHPSERRTELARRLERVRAA